MEVLLISNKGPEAIQGLLASKAVHLPYSAPYMLAWNPRPAMGPGNAALTTKN